MTIYQHFIIAQNVLQFSKYKVVIIGWWHETFIVLLYDLLHSDISNATQILFEKVLGNAKIILPECWNKTTIMHFQQMHWSLCSPLDNEGTLVETDTCKL